MTDLFSSLFDAGRSRINLDEEHDLTDKALDLSDALRDKAPEFCGQIEVLLKQTQTLYENEQRQQFLAGLRCGVRLMMDALAQDPV